MRPGRGTFILEKIRGKRNDIYASQSIKEFTESLSQAILQQIPEQKSIGKRFLDLLKGFHPILSYDALTGQPEISFEFTEQKGAEKTLAAIFQFLETQDRRILIAIDEFQQIANYLSLLHKRKHNISESQPIVYCFMCLCFQDIAGSRCGGRFGAGSFYFCIGGQGGCAQYPPRRHGQGQGHEEGR